MTNLQLLDRISGPSNRKTSDMDTIGYLLDRDIYYFRLASFENYSLEVSLAPTTSANKAHDNDGNFIGYDSYDIGVYSTDPTSISARMSPSGARKVEIIDRDQWRPVSELLKRLKPTIDWNDPNSDSKYEIQKRRTEQQQRWWAANGKFFNFLQLPAEVREIIYEYAIGPAVEPYPRAKTRKLGYAGYGAMVARMANVDLLFTCRLVYHEASDILFRRTTFFVDRAGVLTRLLQNEVQSSRIRKLELALTHFDYFKVFGMRTITTTMYKPQQAAYTIQSMELDKLIIRFAAPGRSSEDWLDNVCQKVVVNWVLEEAWPFIRRHALTRALTVKGFVKQNSRFKLNFREMIEQQQFDLWLRQKIAAGQAGGEVKRYYQELDEDEEDGGCDLDVEKAEEERELMNYDRKSLPIICNCTRKCHARPWRASDYP